MTNEWRSRLWTGSVSVVVALLTVMVTIKWTGNAQAKYDDKLSYRDKIEQLDKNKVDKRTYESDCLSIKSNINNKVSKDVFEVSMKNMDTFITNQLIIQKDIKDMLKANR